MSSELEPARDDDESITDRSVEELAAEVEFLRDELDRLRQSYSRLRRTQYRRTAVAFLVLGLLGTAGAVVFPGVRTILLAFGGTGVFAGVLTWFITPERFVSATVDRAVYETLAAGYDRIVAELGLREQRIYLPTERASAGTRLFVPQHPEYELPAPDDLDSLFVVTGDDERRGIATEPIGERLFGEFERAVQGPVPASPGPLSDTLGEAVIEQFEIADDLSTTLDPESGQVTITVSDSPYGPIDQFDHPVVSFVAVGLARGLERPITVTTTDDGGDVVAVCRWTPDASEPAE